MYVYMLPVTRDAFYLDAFQTGSYYFSQENTMASFKIF